MSNSSMRYSQTILANKLGQSAVLLSAVRGRIPAVCHSDDREPQGPIRLNFT